MSSSMIPGGAPRKPSLVQLFDRLATKIVTALQAIFGMSWASDNEGMVQYQYQATISTGTGDAAGTTYNASLRFSADSAFVCQNIRANVRNDSTQTAAANRGVLYGGCVAPAAAGAAGGFPDCPFTLLLSDGGSDQQFSNEAVDAGLAFSATGNLEGFSGKARFFRPNSNISIRATLLATVPGGCIWVLRLLFSGIRVYKAGLQDLTRARF